MTDITTIENISPYQSRWKIVATVKSRSLLKEFNGKSGPFKTFDAILVDKSKLGIQATFQGDACDKFDSLIEVGKVYEFSGGKVTMANRKYNSTGHDYQIMFFPKSTITLVQDEEVHTELAVVYNFLPLREVVSLTDKSVVDVIGVVMNVEEEKSLTTKLGDSKMKKVSIGDSSHFRLLITLWKSQADLQLKEGDIIAVKLAYVKSYQGEKSLSVGDNSFIQVNPDIDAARQLKLWISSDDYDPSNFDIQQLNQSFSAPVSYLKQIDDQMMGEGKSNWLKVVANLVSFFYSKKLYYPACPNKDCKFKGLTESGGTFTCSKCEKTTTDPVFRFHFGIKIADFSGSANVNVIGIDDELKIIFGGMNAGELKEKLTSIEDDEIAMKEFLQPFLFKQYQLTLKVSSETYQNETKRKIRLAHIVVPEFQMFISAYKQNL